MVGRSSTLRTIFRGPEQLSRPKTDNIDVDDEVSILARGERLVTIREVGIELEDFAMAMARRAHGSSKQAANSAHPPLSL